MAPSTDSGVATIARQLGSTEENWTRATATGTGVQVIGIALKRNVEVKLISQAAREVLGQFALLRSQVVETPKGRLGYQAPDQAAVPSVEALPWPTATPEKTGFIALSGDDSEGHTLSLALATVMKQEMNTPFRNASQKVTGPVEIFRIHVYLDTTLSRSLIILRFNSGSIDRPSAVFVAQGFLTAFNAVVDGQVPQLPEMPGKNELLPTLEEGIPKGKAQKNFLQKGLDTVGYAMSAGKFALFPFSPEYVEPKQQPNFQSELLSYTIGKEATVALLARSKKEKTTFAAAISAAFLMGVASTKELKDKKLDKFSFTSLVDCRSHLEPAVPEKGLGNYTAGISQDEQIKSGTVFWDLARSISAGTERELGKMKQFSELPVLNMLFSQILKRPSLTQKSSLRTALFSLFTEGPLSVQWKNVEKLELAGTSGPMASMHGIGPCFCLAEGLIDGPELTLSLVFAIPVYTRNQMEVLAKSSLEELHAALKDV